jgi:hypothetical protein
MAVEETGLEYERLQALYEKAKGMKRAISPHMDYLRSLSMHAETCVEFGARGGGSTVALSYAKKLYSYDIQRRASDEMTWKRLQIIRGDAWKFIVASSLDVTIPDCDVLLHDSLHSYEHVKAELERHHGSVRGRIVLHDTEEFGRYGEEPYREGQITSRKMRKRQLGEIEAGEREGPPGMKQALDEFLAGHPQWRVERHVEFSCGLTTLARVDGSRR